MRIIFIDRILSDVLIAAQADEHSQVKHRSFEANQNQSAWIPVYTPQCCMRTVLADGSF